MRELVHLRSELHLLRQVLDQPPPHRHRSSLKPDMLVYVGVCVEELLVGSMNRAAEIHLVDPPGEGKGVDQGRGGEGRGGEERGGEERGGEGWGGVG
jgi:hypothetical protein